MGKYMPCKIVNIDLIKIRMCDDTLDDIRHVPNKKKILISLAIFDSNGYKF